MRARSPLAAMAVNGSMQAGESTLLGSLLARQFQVKASAETPPVGVEAAAAGKEDAAFPALLEGLVGVHVQNGAANFGLPAIADRVAALTLPGSLLARQFQAKASAETPPVGAEAPFAGKEDAALPALFEGLAGGFAAADAASPAAALLARGESLPAGHVRSSGGHTRGKFTESERPIARTGRVRLPDKAEPDIDLVTVRPMDAKPAVPEVKPAAQLVASLAVPEPQIAEAGTVRESARTAHHGAAGAAGSRDQSRDPEDSTNGSNARQREDASHRGSHSSAARRRNPEESTRPAACGRGARAFRRHTHGKRAT